MTNALTDVRRPRQVSYDFSGSVVMITGAAQGMGRLHALHFAEAGADLALCDLAEGSLATVEYALGNEAKLQDVAELCRGYGVNVYAAPADVRSEKETEAFVDGAAAALGKIDVGIANAGIAGIVDVLQMSEEAWDGLVDINLKGVFLTLKHAGRQMVRQGGGGSLIAIGSVQAFGGVPGSAHYVAAKHGVAGLCKSLAIELAEHKIRVNYVCPTAVETTMGGIIEAPSTPSGHGERLFHATGCWNFLDEGSPPIQAEEVSQAVMFLASDASLYVTGSPFFVDAGFLAK